MFERETSGNCATTDAARRRWCSSMREGITLRVDRRSVVVFSWLFAVVGSGWMRLAPAHAADGAQLAPTASAQTLGAADPGPGHGGASRGGLDPDALSQPLEPVLQEPLLMRASAGIHVVDLATGDEVFNHLGDVPFIPAST